MKNEPVHMNDLNKRQCLALPTQQPRISRVSGSLKLFLLLFTLPLSHKRLSPGTKLLIYCIQFSIYRM